MKHLNALDLVKSLSAVWSIYVGEDENKNKFAETRDVRDEFIHGFENEKLGISELVEKITSKLVVMDVELFTSDNQVGDQNNDVYGRALLASTKLGHLTLDDVVQSQLEANEFITDEHSDGLNDYIELSQRLSLALGINDSDEVINQDYWERAHDDGLRPIDAVTGSVSR